MTNSVPLISFCIPTYNREKSLSKSIEAIISQLHDESKVRVEVVVSDNASTDETRRTVEQLILSRPDMRIRLISSRVNVGMDGNFLNCFKNAKGKFVCLVSDDDFLLPGSVDIIMDIVGKHPELGGVFLNSFEIGGRPAESEGICDDPDEALERIGNRIFHLSALLFARELFDLKEYERLSGCFIVQSYVFLDAIMARKGIYFTRERFFQITENNSSGGYNFFVVFVTNFCDLLDYATKIGFSSLAVSRVKWQHLRYFLIPFIIDFRLNNSHAKVKKHYLEGFRLIVDKYGLGLTVSLGAVPALFFPKIFWVGVRGVVRVFKRIVR